MEGGEKEGTEEERMTRPDVYKQGGDMVEDSKRDKKRGDRDMEEGRVG